MAERPDVIVIGGGAIGCGAAYYLARQGCHVRLLEASQIGQACSHGNCGFICPSHALPLTAPGAVRRVMGSMFNRDSALYIKPRFDPALWSWLVRFALRCRQQPMMQVAAARHALLSSSMKLYRELIAEESLDVEWEDRGLLFVYKSPHEFAAYEKTAELLRREFGIEMVPYEGARLAALEPALRPELAGGWHCPTDAHLRPDRLMAALIPVLRARGVEILEGTTVEGIDVAAGQARGVETSRGKMQCDLIVLATGAESPKLARLLGFHLPVQPGKGYSITLPRPERAPQIPLILEESHVAVTPWLSGLRIGSTMEFTGYDRSINPRRIELFKRAAAEHLVEPAAGPILEEWYGWRPMTYDELPCIGRAPKVPNVIVAAGHGMIGISSMTATGKLVAELALNQVPHLDPAPYSPRRFAP
jgi:D-amino-acid dehydrogenase